MVCLHPLWISAKMRLQEATIFVARRIFRSRHQTQNGTTFTAHRSVRCSASGAAGLFKRPDGSTMRYQAKFLLSEATKKPTCNSLFIPICSLLAQLGHLFCICLRGLNDYRIENCEEDGSRAPAYGDFKRCFRGPTC